MLLFFNDNTGGGESPPARKSPAEDAAKPTWIGKDLRFQGEITADENIFVQGFVEGKVTSNAQVVIQPEGRLQADVSAKRIEVHGTVVGDLMASEAVILGAEARVTGNVTAPSVAVSPGATFHGLTRTESRTETGSTESDKDSPGA